jgi:hypothetical protein
MGAVVEFVTCHGEELEQCCVVTCYVYCVNVRKQEICQRDKRETFKPGELRTFSAGLLSTVQTI